MKGIISKAKDLLQKQGQAHYLSNGCPVDAPLSKPKKGEHRKKKAAERKAVLERFRGEVMRLGDCWGCQNPFMEGLALIPDAPHGRSFLEAAHIVGRGRRFSNEPWNGIKLCWWCHDAVDGRHNELWPELTPDQRMIKILRWWKENRPGYFDRRGWQKPLDRLESRQHTRDKE